MYIFINIGFTDIFITGGPGEGLMDGFSAPGKVDL